MSFLASSQTETTTSGATSPARRVSSSPVEPTTDWPLAIWSDMSAATHAAASFASAARSRTTRSFISSENSAPVPLGMTWSSPSASTDLSAGWLDGSPKCAPLGRGSTDERSAFTVPRRREPSRPVALEAAGAFEK